MEENKTTIQLSEKEQLRRQKMLSGDQMSILFSIALPLVFYNSIGQIFQFIDTLIAADMSSEVVTTVSFVMQIEKMLQAVGSGLAIGGGVLIGRAFGSGDMEKVKKLISSIFIIAIGIGLVLFLVIVPFMYPVLRFFGMRADLCTQGTVYADLVVASIVFQFINTIFFAIQKSQGKTKIIMWGNLLVIAIKSSINVITISFVKKGVIPVEQGIYYLPVATLLAHFILNIIAITNLASKKNPFRLSWKSRCFDREFIRSLSGLSVPVFLEKFIFAAGKAVVNGLCGRFPAKNAVGALGVSDRICGFATNPISGVQEAESSLISNNIGNENIKRAVSFFWRSLVLSLSYVSVVFIVTYIFEDDLINLFAKEKGNEFAGQIKEIFDLERYDNFLIAINASVMGLLYGFGKTKISMVLNIIRLFGYRIPSLLLLIYLSDSGNQALNILGVSFTGLEPIGLAMLISNSLVGITGGIVAIRFIRKNTVQSDNC